MTGLALCLIARNEEALLPGCLRSVEGLVDEVILADTGSTDATVQVARGFGARVLHHPWNDDFADARNAALAGTSQPWILVLDADERLGPGAATAIRQALQDADFDCGALPLFNSNRLDATPEEILDGRARDVEPVLLPRLLRHTPDLAWEGVVHESVAGWITRGARTVRQLPAPILHLGSVPQVRQARSKSGRNLLLLRRRLAAEPAWIAGYEYLAVELFRSGAPEEARQVLEEGWARLARTLVEPGPRPSAITLAQLRAQSQLQEGQGESAIATIQAMRRWGYDHPNLDWVEARVLVAAATRAALPDPAGLTRALSLLDRCLQSGGRLYMEEPIPGIFGFASHMEAGHACLMLGRPGEALVHFDGVLAARPQDTAASLGRAEALVGLRRVQEALVVLEPLLPRSIPDAWILAALAAETLGALQEARRLAAEAVRLKDRPFFVPRRFLLVNRVLGAPVAGSGR